MWSWVLGAALAACLLVAGAAPVSAQGTPASAAEVARGKYIFGPTGGWGGHTVPTGPGGGGAAGQYLFGAPGRCGCHTVPKGPVNAGGRRYDGPFGTVFSTNITPDRQTGIGMWTDEQRSEG